MEQRNRNRTTYGLWFDLPFIIRVMRRWIIPAFALAATLMVGMYIVEDKYLLKDECTASAIISVIPKERSTSTLSDGNISSAVTRITNMWNSNSLKKTIEKANPDRKINGSLYCHTISGTNLVKILAISDNAQDAFYLLNEALRNYRQIISNFDITYLPVILTDTVVSGVTVVKPNPWKYAILLFIAAFGGVLGIVGLWTLTTDLLHGEKQTEELLEVPLYETLPKVRKRRRQKAVLVTNPKLSLNYLEGIDTISSRIAQHMLRHNQKSVLITSFGENEGKTTIAANVAINLAHRGNKTLLIDLDFRRPSIWKILDQKKGEENRSYSYFLENGMSITDHIAVREDLWNLNVIWQFASVQDADQFMENSNLAEQIKELSELYDYIIVDTAPMGLVRDADVVASMVDASFLVIRQDFNHAPVENDITDQLEEFHAPCMGAVLNCCHSVRRHPHLKKNHYQKGGR